MRMRRLRREPAGLDVTAFINLIVVLVPFMLSTAVFTRLAVLDMSLPAQASGVLDKLSADKLNLEIVIRADAIEVGDRIGGLIQRVPMTSAGAHDVAQLATLMRVIKERFPDKTDATVLAEPAVPYDTLVQVMDVTRATRQVQGTKLVEVALFPDISIGDAPIRTAAAPAGGAR
jgi:biopolymer transport protein ExbD